MAPQKNPVAITGIACRLPGKVNDLDALWDFCVKARCAAGPIPQDRFNAGQHYHPNRNKAGHFFSQGGSFLEGDISAFDASFFNISEAEAKSMDPQQRLLLETTFHALENAGIDSGSISGCTDIGVFAAGSEVEYQERFKLDPFQAPVYAATGAATTMFANRISYFFNLKGPSITTDTACSSALTALHLAVQSIQSGECSCAIVGSSCLQLSPYMIAFFSKLGTLGRDGISYSFDHRASGYGRGEGVICIILKSEDQAVLDNDCIRALIRGSGVNHAGRSQGITLPDVQSQADLISSVYKHAGLDPHETDYVEAHGTGTERGDPIEAKSISAGLEARTRGSGKPLLIGSAKSNFGHLEYASGLLAVIKCVAMLERSMILPSANFEQVNPAINLPELNLSVPTETVSWPRQLRRISVNNFGFGGSNAHIILEHAPSLTTTLVNGAGCNENNAPKSDPESTFYPFVMSAKDSVSLQSYLRELKDWIQTATGHQEFLRDLSYTLCCRRTLFSHRHAVFASTANGLLQSLENALHVERKSSSNKLVFIFTGQGAQWAQMGLSLIHFPVFAKALQEAEKSLRTLGAQWSLLDEISRPAESSRIGDTIISQPAVTALQLSMILLLQSWNLRPDAVCGHSSGEIAAAFAAGILDFEVCMALAYYRGEAASQVSGAMPKGAMIAVGASPAFIEPYIGSLRTGIASIACFNSPESVTVSGDLPAILELREILQDKGTFNRLLKVEVAYHSDHMVPAAEVYLKKIEQILSKTSVQPATSRFYSSVSGIEEQSRAVASPWYWVTNLLCPVQFSKAVSKLLADISPRQVFSFIEIGPHSALKSPLRDIVRDFESSRESTSSINTMYFSALRRNENSSSVFMELATSLINRGIDLHPAAIFRSITDLSTCRLLTNLPQYRFDTSRKYWHETRSTSQLYHHGSLWHVLLGHKITGTIGDSLEFRNVFSLNDIPWLQDHQVNGEVLFPAAGYLSMAVEAIRFQQEREAVSPVNGYLIREVTIGKAFRLSEDVKHELFTILRPQLSGTRGSEVSVWFQFQIFSWSKEDSLSEHCSGFISMSSVRKHDAITQSSVRLTSRTRMMDLVQDIEKSSQRVVSPEILYRQLRRIGLSYGPMFARVSELRTGDDCAIGTVTSQNTNICMPEEFESPLRIHPTTLDAILHVGLCNLGGNRGDPTKVRTHVPIFIESLHISEDFQQQAGINTKVYSHNIFTEKMSRSSTCSLTCLQDGVEDPVLEFRGFKVFDIQEDNRLYSNAETINPLMVEWMDHPGFLDSDCLDDWNDTDIEQISGQAEVNALDQQAYYLIKWAISVCLTKPPKAENHLSLLWEWMNSVLSDSSLSNKLFMSQKWPDLDEREMWQFVDEVASHSFQGEFNAKVGRQLPTLLSQQGDVMGILFQRDGLWRIYEESNLFSRSNRQLAQLVNRLSRDNPSLRILEVGAGTGGLTSKLLSVLTEPSLQERRYDIYDYTDISPGFFEKARLKFEEFPGLNFRCFDISKDPSDQGFANVKYDLVVAMDVLHATPDVSKSLAHIRKLLKPNGVLALVELNEFRLHLFPFALLPGWWQRETGPIIKEEEWQELLVRNGYTGIEANIGDFPNVGLHRIYWTHASCEKETPPPKVHLIQSDDQLVSNTLAAKICSVLVERRYSFESSGLSLDTRKIEGSTVIFLDQAADFLLERMDEGHFETLKSILHHGSGLLWVTRSSDPSARFVSGFVKALQLESPHVKLAVLHLDNSNTHDVSALNIVKLCEYLYTKTLSEATRSDVEFREVSKKIQIPRLVQAKPLYDFIAINSGPAQIHQESLFQKDRFRELTIGNVGLLGSLYFQDSNISPLLEENQVLLRIEATGINFKDVMIALGTLPWQGLGREASGVVISSGIQVEAEFPVGTRVLHWGDSLIASHAKATRSNLVKIPDSMTFEQAASIPVVYTTAYESLVNLGRLQMDETVLIHAASGGVGQAAIMIAKWIGAEIYCTVSSQEKKDLIMRLYDISEDHIMSSRNTSFAKGILSMTDNAGVDVILNSLAGDMLRASWQCIARFGRFIDISKRDAAANSNLEMSPFDRSATYTALDLSLYADEGKRGRQKLTMDVLKLFETKAVRPVLPINVIPVTELDTAFRMLQMGKHMGKVVIQNDSDAVVNVQKSLPSIAKILPDATYLITGGSGGLGQYICWWLLDNGAKHILLVSRNAPKICSSEPFQYLLKKATICNGKLWVVACDVSVLADVQRVVTSTKVKGMPPIRGIIHGAMVLKDSIFETASFMEWQSVIQPKVHGAINLHRALTAEPLDFFICLSSLVGTLGNAGQSSYAGSNSFIDEFCQWRIRQGYPAASIALPAITDVGYVAKVVATSNPSILSSGDLYDFQMSGENVAELLKAALNFQSLSSHVVAGLSTTLELADTPRMRNPLLNHVRKALERRSTKSQKSRQNVQDSIDRSVEPIIDRLAFIGARDMETATAIVFDAMAKKMAQDMMISPQDILLETSLAQIGLDSLVAVELRNWLAKELSTNVRVMDIINSKSMKGLVDLICQQSSLLSELRSTV